MQQVLLYIFVISGFSTVLIFLFRIEWLFNKKSFLSILGIDLLLFLVSFIVKEKNIQVLRVALLSSIIFFALYKAFVLRYKRNPENTFYAFEKKPVQDVMFTILFWLLSGLMVLFV